MVQEDIKSKRMRIPDWFPRVEESKYHSESFCTEQGGCKNMTHAGRGGVHKNLTFAGWEGRGVQKGQKNADVINEGTLNKETIGQDGGLRMKHSRKGINVCDMKVRTKGSLTQPISSFLNKNKSDTTLGGLDS